MLYYAQAARQTLNDLDTTENGLAISEARERLQRYGLNAIKVNGEPLWRKLVEPFANVFMAVLLAAAVISLWQHALLDAIIILVIMAVSVTIYYVQRFSTERILRSLQKHDALAVEVLRDGKSTTLDASQLVPGDVILLGEGEKVPADARLFEVRSLRVDESQLTGESLPVSKQIELLRGEKPLYEQSNMLFQGSFVVSGEAKAIVVATGNATEFGSLAALAKDTALESPVQRKIDRLLAQIIAVVAGIAAVTFALSLLRGVTIVESFRFVLALSVSTVPEDLPIAISVVLVLGMRRMAAKKALVRTMRAIETIGIITTIATDKTGTLTKNLLTVQATWRPAHARGQFAELIARGINRSAEKLHDPLDTALHLFIQDKNIALSKQMPLIRLPFDQSVAMSGNVWHNGNQYDLVVKGAPEHVLARSDLTESEHEKATVELHKLTSQGYRVLAVAHQRLDRAIETFVELRPKDKFTFEGYVAVADVLRPEAKKAIGDALKAGVIVRMITGDHFETAYHIGRQLGMVQTRDQVFDSRHMSAMSDEDLEKIIDEIRVFSRVVPEHKYRILSLLKKHNITAMTGDGVNDVPALANAHVGVAMGSGASIAKDAGDIILIDNNFKSIVDAMREGRVIFANIRRMLFYLLSTNVGEVLTMIGALLVGLPVPLVPVQILWVNLVTDTAMVIPLGLEPGEKSHMTRRPSQPDAPLLGKLLVSRMVLLAFAMAAVTLTLYALFGRQYGYDYGSTIAFSALVVMQWASALSTRSDDESLLHRIHTISWPFYTGLTVAVGMQLFALFGPLAALLHVTPVAIGDLVITGAIAFIVPIVLSETHKYIGRRFYNRA